MPKSIRSDAYLKSLPVLLAARTEKGVTQTELAARLNKPQSYVSKVERGERRLDIAEFLQWADALKASPTALLSKVRAAISA